MMPEVVFGAFIFMELILFMYVYIKMILIRFDYSRTSLEKTKQFLQIETKVSHQLY